MKCTMKQFTIPVKGSHSANVSIFWSQPVEGAVVLWTSCLTCVAMALNYTNPGYGLSLVDTLWNAGSYRQPLEQEGNPMT